jgi:hypothetical protein
MTSAQKCISHGYSSSRRCVLLNVFLQLASAVLLPVIVEENSKLVLHPRMYLQIVLTLNGNSLHFMGCSS